MSHSIFFATTGQWGGTCTNCPCLQPNGRGPCRPNAQSTRGIPRAASGFNLVRYTRERRGGLAVRAEPRNVMADIPRKQVPDAADLGNMRRGQGGVSALLQVSTTGGKIETLDPAADLRDNSAFSGDSAANQDKERAIGPDYTSVRPTYLQDKNNRRSNCYRDEAHDFLEAELCPHRIEARRATSPRSKKRAFADFERMARRSFQVAEAVRGGGKIDADAHRATLQKPRTTRPPRHIACCSRCATSGRH